MKRLFRNLAIALSFVLLASIISPAATVVHAAAKITLKSGAAAPSVIYAGKYYTLKVAGTKVKFTSSNKKVATIGMTTGKLKAIAPGTVKITAKNAKTGKTVATKSFTVNQRATAVSANVTDLYLSVGDTYTIQTTKTPTTSTDVVRLYSVNKTIVTVGTTGGKVTAKKDGTTQIKIYSKATKATSNSNKYNKVAYVNVYVGAYMDSAWQTSLTEIAVKFKTDVKDLKTQDFQVMNEKTQVVYPIKSVAVDQADSKQVILTLFNDIKDGEAYTVKYGQTSAKFSATNGKVHSLSVTPVSLAVNEETEIFVQAKDANGVLLEKISSVTVNQSSYYSIKINPGTNGYLSDNKLVLMTKGAQAQVTAEYHTYEYENGVEKGAITVNATVVADREIDNSVAAAKYHLDKKQTVTEQEFIKANSKVSMGETMYAHIKLYTANGKEVTDYENYSVMSSDTQTLITDGNLNQKSPIMVVPVKEGKANIIVMYKGNGIKALPVSVLAERKPVKVVATGNVAAEISDAREVNQKAVFNLRVIDQYGEEMPLAQHATVTLNPGAPDNTTKALTDAHFFIRENQLIFSGAELGKGTYPIKVTAGSGSLGLTVIVKSAAESTGAVRYQIVLDQDKADSTVRTTEDVDKMIKINVQELKGNVATGIVDIASIQLSDSNGNNVTEKYLRDNMFVVTRMSENGVVAATPADTYTLQVTIAPAGKELKFTRSIVVENSQPALTVSMEKNSYQRTNQYSNYEMVQNILKNNFSFTIGGIKLDQNKLSFVVNDSSYILLDTTVVIQEIGVLVPVNGLDRVLIEYKVKVQKSIALK